jgi:hypothetical protein
MPRRWQNLQVISGLLFNWTVSRDRVLLQKIKSSPSVDGNDAKQSQFIVCWLIFSCIHKTNFIEKSPLPRDFFNRMTYDLGKGL